MVKVCLSLILVLFSGTVWAQTGAYTNVAENRQMLWTEVNLVYKTKGPWSFQIDHQYRRQAADVGTRDWNIVRYPLLQVFRPWIAYEVSESVKLSLSPVGLWWNWQRELEDPSTKFFQEIRIIPQLQITRPVGDGQLIQRYRTELRWPSALDTVSRSYLFLADGEPELVLADRFDVRVRAMARWLNPIFQRTPDEKRWYSHLSVEPMVVVSDKSISFNQNRSLLALGRYLNKSIRVELGYLNQFSINKRAAEQVRTFRFNNALHVYLYAENATQWFERKRDR
ncbi:hypothetical protein GCM10023189_00380 [Nibrella saemangeumensis]|uniref:DUF2490 domain-containing protein n=1 Tax=Nibrella saemangeumensis TaxID=1084526 RepID=A0ABP8MBI8_9BACT